MQENSPIKERILTYLDYKGVTRYKFYKVTGITRGILDQKNGITEDNLLKFLYYAQDISLKWLLFGEGDIIKEGMDPKPRSHLGPSEAFFKNLFERQQVEIKDLNREIGKLQLIIEQLKKDKPDNDYNFTAEP